MIKISAVIFCLLIATALFAVDPQVLKMDRDHLQDNPGNIRVATFNIRSFHGSDPQDWNSRRRSIDSIFNMYDFDIIGIQEPYQPQIEELQKLYGGVYDSYVVPTGNFNSKGWSHSNPVFYRKDRFTLLDKGVFWFSETPDSMGSVSWEASQARNCVWVKLEDKKTGNSFYIFNSHFDHKSSNARNHSAKLLKEQVQQIAGKSLAICTGDFNSSQNSSAYKTLSNGFLIDTYSLAKKVENENYRSSHGYKTIPPEPNARRIDHIFITRKFKNKKITYWKICNEDFNGNWASDHFPVYIDLTLE